MNWVGGTRNRIKTQNERKVQREFFERKKFSDKVHVYRSIGATGIRKHGFGQDLRAFQTVNIAHSTQKGNGSSSKSVKKVDLDVSKPVISRMVEDIDLGPTSPPSSVSKINLMEPKYEKRNSTSEEIPIFPKHKKLIEHKLNYNSDIVKFEPYSRPSPYKFKKPEPVKPKFTDFERGISKKFGHKDMEPETPVFQSFYESSVQKTAKSTDNGNYYQDIDLFPDKQRNMFYSHYEGNHKKIHTKDSSRFRSKYQTDSSVSQTSNSSVHFSDKVTVSTISRKMHRSSSKDRTKKSKKKSSGENLFITEDFQVTPLKNYQQKASQHTSSNESKENNQNKDGYLSPKGVFDRVFTSADFIETPFKKRKFSISKSPSMLYPKTSTPRHIESSADVISPMVDDILQKKLQTPDVKNSHVPLTERMFYGSVKEFYHMQESPPCMNINLGRQVENFDDFSPQEGSSFPEGMFLEKNFRNDSKDIVDTTIFPNKIELKKDSTGSTNAIYNDSICTGSQNTLQNSEKEMNKTSRRDSQVEEILAEMTELDRQDFTDQICEELQKYEEIKHGDCQETWEIDGKDGKDIDNKILTDADSRQEQVTRNVVTKVLKEIVSKIENDADILSPVAFNHSSIDLHTPPCSEFEICTKPEYLDEDEFVLTPNHQQTIGSIKNNKMSTIETQTDGKLYVDSSTSPFLLIQLTEDKSVQCSISRGVSPHFHDDKSQSSDKDLRVIPLKMCPAVCLERLEDEVFCDSKQEVKIETYSLRSRKLS